MSQQSSAVAKARMVKEKVLELLENYPESRNSDRLLMALYWEKVDGLIFDESFPLAFVSKGTSPETITRARRSIQAAGLFHPTNLDVAERRGILQKELRDHYAKGE